MPLNQLILSVPTRNWKFEADIQLYKREKRKNLKVKIRKSNYLKKWGWDSTLMPESFLNGIQTRVNIPIALSRCSL